MIHVHHLSEAWARPRVVAVAPRRAPEDAAGRRTTGPPPPPPSTPKPQVWVKPSSEMQFLYGNHVLKSGLGRITEATPAYAGVVVLSMSDVPLGFGVAAKSTSDCRKMDPGGIIVFHQSDVGEYLRKEDEGL